MNIPFHKPMVPDSFNDILSKSIRGGWLNYRIRGKEL